MLCFMLSTFAGWLLPALARSALVQSFSLVVVHTLLLPQSLSVCNLSQCRRYQCMSDWYHPGQGNIKLTGLGV